MPRSLFTVHVPWGEVALRTVWPKFKLERGRRRRGRRRLRHHDQPLPVLLAGLRGGRGHATQARASRCWRDAGRGARASCGASAGTPGSAWSTPTSPPTSSSSPRGHPPRRRHHRHQHRRPGRDRAEAAGGRIRLPAVRAGILGVGLIGVPVLAGSAAYALAEAMGWKEGLERKCTRRAGLLRRDRASACSLGLVIQYSPINPMKALFWSAVINGVVAVPLMAVIMLLAAEKKCDGRVYGQPQPGRSRLDQHGGDGNRGHRHVHSQLARLAGASRSMEHERRLRTRKGEEVSSRVFYARILQVPVRWDAHFCRPRLEGARWRWRSAERSQARLDDRPKPAHTADSGTSRALVMEPVLHSAPARLSCSQDPFTDAGSLSQTQGLDTEKGSLRPRLTRVVFRPVSCLTL